LGRGVVHGNILCLNRTVYSIALFEKKTNWRCKKAGTAEKRGSDLAFFTFT